MALIIEKEFEFCEGYGDVLSAVAIVNASILMIWSGSRINISREHLDRISNYFALKSNR